MLLVRSKKNVKTSKSKPSRKPLKKSDIRGKNGVAVDKGQLMAKSTTSGPKRESKKDANARCSSGEEMNRDAKVDARKKSGGNVDNQKHDALPIESTDYEEVDAMMNPNLSKAKYTNKTEDLQSQGNQKAVQYTGKNVQRNDICYEFERNGACLRKGCKSIHMNRNVAYANYSDKDRNLQNMPKNNRRKNN